MLVVDDGNLKLNYLSMNQILTVELIGTNPKFSWLLVSDDSVETQESLGGREKQSRSQQMG